MTLDIYETGTHVIECARGGTAEAPVLVLTRLSGKPLTEAEWSAIAAMLQWALAATGVAGVGVSWEDES
jgi:hypothetical protein